MDNFLSLVNSQLLLAAGLGALVGLEREISGKDPGLRTFALIAVGACAFTMTAAHQYAEVRVGDPSRIAAQIVSGIGFIGAGAIFRANRKVSGLTTAALMWVTASIGMGVGFRRYDIAVSTTAIALGITLLLRFVHLVIRKVQRRGSDTAIFELD